MKDTIIITVIQFSKLSNLHIASLGLPEKENLSVDNASSESADTLSSIA